MLGVIDGGVGMHNDFSRKLSNYVHTIVQKASNGKLLAVNIIQLIKKKEKRGSYGKKKSRLTPLQSVHGVPASYSGHSHDRAQQ